MEQTRRELLGSYDDVLHKFERARRRAHELRTSGHTTAAKDLLADARNATRKTRDELRATARKTPKER